MQAPEPSSPDPLTTIISNPQSSNDILRAEKNVLSLENLLLIKSRFFRRCQRIHPCSFVAYEGKVSYLDSTHPCPYPFGWRSEQIDTGDSCLSVSITCCSIRFYVQGSVNLESTRIGGTGFRFFFCFLLETHFKLVVPVASNEEFAEDVTFARNSGAHVLLLCCRL
jgi:hypothetical protein